MTRTSVAGLANRDAFALRRKFHPESTGAKYAPTVLWRAKSPMRWNRPHATVGHAPCPAQRSTSTQIAYEADRKGYSITSAKTRRCRRRGYLVAICTGRPMPKGAANVMEMFAIHRGPRLGTPALSTCLTISRLRASRPQGRVRISEGDQLFRPCSAG